MMAKGEPNRQLWYSGMKKMSIVDKFAWDNGGLVKGTVSLQT
jgi:hypothetical protein